MRNSGLPSISWRGLYPTPLILRVVYIPIFFPTVADFPSATHILQSLQNGLHVYLNVSPLSWPQISRVIESWDMNHCLLCSLTQLNTVDDQAVPCHSVTYLYHTVNTTSCWLRSNSQYSYLFLQISRTLVIHVRRKSIAFCFCLLRCTLSPFSLLRSSVA